MPESAPKRSSLLSPFDEIASLARLQDLGTECFCAAAVRAATAKALPFDRAADLRLERLSRELLLVLPAYDFHLIEQPIEGV